MIIIENFIQFIQSMNIDHIISDSNNFYDCIDDDEEEVMECRNEGDQLHSNCADNINGIFEDENIEENMENEDFFNLIDDTLIHPNLSCKTADAILMILGSAFGPATTIPFCFGLKFYFTKNQIFFG